MSGIDQFGAVVLHQIPTAWELAGITLVMAGIAIHKVQEEDQWTTCDSARQA